MKADDVPQVPCPGCGILQEDHDGFGVLHCEHCGFCTHAAKSRTFASWPAVAQTIGTGPWKCDICGAEVPDAAHQP